MRIVVPMVVMPDGDVRFAVVVDEEARKLGGFLVMI